MAVSLEAHFASALPYGTLVCALIWEFFRRTCAESVIRLILPKAVYAELKERRKNDKTFNRMCKDNAVAFTHAVIVTPIAIYCFTLDPSLANDHYEGASVVYDILCWIMGGYFLWDIFVCVANLRLYGVAFLIHAIISLVGVYVQAASNRAKLCWYSAILMGSEISTPWLHIRSYLNKGGATEGWYFKLMNVIFIFTFVFYRLIFMEAAAFYPLIDGFFKGRFSMSNTRALSLTLLILIWCVLNYFWGYLMLRSQLRQWQKRRKESTKAK